MDPLYVALHPFHQWAQIAAVCAFVLAAASCFILAISRRFSSRWWLGCGVLALCLLVVAFGARSRGFAADVREIGAECSVHPSADCSLWFSWLADAQQRVVGLGIAAVIASALTVIVAVFAVVRWRRSGEEPRHFSPRVVLTIIGIIVAGSATFQLANSIASWIQAASYPTSPFDDMAGIIFILPVFGTIVGSLALIVGLIVVIASSPRRAQPIAAPA